LLAALLATPAFAADAPQIMPTRDVDVIYRIAGPTAPLEQRLRWGISEGKLRVDLPSPGMFVIIDTKTHAVQAVREENRSVTLLPGSAAALPGVAPSGVFTRGTDDNVAGLACTNWQTQDTSGRIVLACLTSDGVLLRAVSDGVILVQASQVNFTPQLEAVFRVPADYRKITTKPASQN
jgi:hypothetical protein